MNNFILGIVIILLFFGLGCVNPDEEGGEIIRYKAEITKVIDGDTVELVNGERVRLLGINAPEKGEKCNSEANAYLESLISGKEITLEVGTTNRDKYGRQLRYLWDKQEFINGKLVEEGYATVYIVGNEYKYTQILGQLQQQAQLNEKCIWEYSSAVYMEDECIEISEFIFDAEGDDSINPNGEKIVLQNNCDYKIDMSDWRIKDEATNSFTFPEIEFEENSKLNIFSGKGINYSNNIFMQKGNSIWNNDHDSLFLRNKNGDLVLYYTYGN